MRITNRLAHESSVDFEQQTQTLALCPWCMQEGQAAEDTAHVEFDRLQGQLTCFDPGGFEETRHEPQDFLSRMLCALDKIRSWLALQCRDPGSLRIAAHS